MMTPEERAAQVLREYRHETGGVMADPLFVGRAIAAAIRAAVDEEREACAKEGDAVAAAHRRIGVQGRFTADYREGAVDSALHVAHLIRRRTKA